MWNVYGGSAKRRGASGGKQDKNAWRHLGLQVQCRVYQLGFHITRCSPCPWVVRHCGGVELAENKWPTDGITSIYTQPRGHFAPTVQPPTAESTPCAHTYAPNIGNYSLLKDPYRVWGSWAGSADVSRQQFNFQWTVQSRGSLAWFLRGISWIHCIWTWTWTWIWIWTSPLPGSWY